MNEEEEEGGMNLDQNQNSLISAIAGGIGSMRHGYMVLRGLEAGRTSWMAQLRQGPIIEEAQSL